MSNKKEKMTMCRHIRKDCPICHKKKSVASVSGGTKSSGDVIVGMSGCIRYDDVMTVQGFDIQVSKAVELGMKYKIPLAFDLEKDLKSESGLLLTFPIAMLMSKLQEQKEIGDGVTLLNLVKP